MIFVYNFLQILLLVITLPLLALVILGTKKYRGTIRQRLGFSLPAALGNISPAGRKVIWMHALSVGEVTSALPLVRGLRQETDDVIIIFSATTVTGRSTAAKLIAPYVDCIISGPLDLLFSINRFIHHIRPDLFILIETDFWPNWLYLLQRKKIPMMLVNGRVSEKSFTTYRKFQFFFLPMFRSFSLLSMQTGHDAAQMAQLGIPEKKITTLGNLKYDTALMVDEGRATLGKADLLLPAGCIIWLCGSTHRGEEEILLAAFDRLRKKFENLALIIAPRDPGRSSEINDLADAMKLPANRRTIRDNPEADVLILDTIGELTQCYKLAKIAFIGGSLVPSGGHNPLEASVFGVPVLFGPHMDDFREIAAECLQYNAGIEVRSVDEITAVVNNILLDAVRYSAMSQAAKQLVRDKSGVVSRHLVEIRKLIGETST
ncbi:MAG: 3-deoxy-D-manno-octulosonic acid transferase [Desulfobulbaceae bacterium]|nr:3-deoxy-D-manno-octulosonic acid transferase [Desulfobulbaceae bacterium]